MITSTSSASLLSQVQINDWVQIGSTIVLSATAFLAPYIIERWRSTFRSPKLKIQFKLEPPDCHQTQMIGPTINYPVYYFRFIVANIGKTQAEDCEVFLEKIYKENSAEAMIEIDNFTPINLKWSGVRDPFKRLIQPGKEMYCDIGRIQHPDHPFYSVYRNISEIDKEVNKFIFELPERYYSQWDCLTPGRYKLIISVYSKNAEKTTKSFGLSWTGRWENNEKDMFNELVIT